LCVDIISWRILLEDLQSSYQALAAGREPALPLKTVSIKRWAEAMEGYAQTEQAESELEFWRAVGAHDLAGLPVDSHAGGNTADSSATIVAQLSVEHTRTLITDIPRQFNAGVNDALLLALAQAVARAAGQTGLFVALEGHGRERLWEGADPSRTVGWFTSLYPVLLRVPGGSDVAAQLAAVRDQYRAIPNHGVGYGILRYLSRRQDVRDRLGDLPQPQISFLYMGQTDQAFPADALFVPAAGDMGPAYDPTGERAHLLELNSGITQGQFRISWTYSSNRHRAETVQALADAFIDALRDLIEQTLRVHAPDDQVTDERGVDFTAEELSADDLAEILRQQES
jgi:non-ribosomal peptide synthase protein (TIGR01720 family)